jgi:hypothetical protein
VERLSCTVIVAINTDTSADDGHCTTGDH